MPSVQLGIVSPDAAATVNSMSMTEMKKRVAAIGAELDIQPGKTGIAVLLLMPVKTGRT